MAGAELNIDDMVDPEPASITSELFERFLSTRLCAGCGSLTLEGFMFSNPETGQTDLMFGSMPDARLHRFVPVLPFVCLECGLMGSYWTKFVQEWAEHARDE